MYTGLYQEKEVNKIFCIYTNLSTTLLDTQYSQKVHFFKTKSRIVEQADLELMMSHECSPSRVLRI